MDNFNYGKNLKEVRLRKGVSQEELANGLNVSQATYSRMECQTDIISYRKVRKIAQILDVSPLELMPQFEELNDEEVRTIKGMGAPHKYKIFLNSPAGTIILVAASIAIVDAVYSAAKGFCAGFGTSETTMFTVSGLVAVGTIAVLWYSIEKIRKQG